MLNYTTIDPYNAFLKCFLATSNDLPEKCFKFSQPHAWANGGAEPNIVLTLGHFLAITQSQLPIFKAKIWKYYRKSLVHNVPLDDKDWQIICIGWREVVDYDWFTIIKLTQMF